jgi:LacI family transcriptional regulator
MVDRPTIADLAARAGVSIATVDRVLNRRLPVRSDTAQRVVEAAEAIGFHATGLLKRRLTEVPTRKFAFLLQKRDEFYLQMAAELTAAIRAAREIEGKIHIEFIEEIEPQIVAQRIREVAPRFDATAAIVLSHPATHDAIEHVRGLGKPVFTLQSPVQSEHCAGHIGVDGRACGRIAGWTISRQARKPGKVGIIVGSHNYLNQESSEIAFRTYMREHGPEFQLLEPIINFDDETIAYESVSKMLHDTPNLVAIYEAGGGMAGLIRALRERKGKKRPVTVCNELTEATRKGLVDGIIDVALVTPLPAMARRCVEQMIKATNASDVPHFQPAFLPPDIRMSENV